MSFDYSLSPGRLRSPDLGWAGLAFDVLIPEVWGYRSGYGVPIVPTGEVLQPDIEMESQESKARNGIPQSLVGSVN